MGVGTHGNVFHQKRWRIHRKGPEQKTNLTKLQLIGKRFISGKGQRGGGDQRRSSRRCVRERLEKKENLKNRRTALRR